jgi:hypothetical protein
MQYMPVRKWHYGKIVILWIWGGLVAGLSLTLFMSRPVETSPVAHLIEAVLFLVTTVALSFVTWHWLGGKESQ